MAAQFAPVHPTDNSRSDNLYLLPKQAVDRHVEDGPQNGFIDEEGDMSEYDLVKASCYNRQTHNDVDHMIWEALEEHVKERLRCLIDVRCEKVFLAHFERSS